VRRRVYIPFQSEKVHYERKCSECRKVIPGGTVSFASRIGPKVLKVVCSEDCRLDFDQRYWENIADAHDKTQNG